MFSSCFRSISGSLLSTDEARPPQPGTLACVAITTTFSSCISKGRSHLPPQLFMNSLLAPALLDNSYSTPLQCLQFLGPFKKFLLICPLPFNTLRLALLGRSICLNLSIFPLKFVSFLMAGAMPCLSLYFQNLEVPGL